MILDFLHEKPELALALIAVFALLAFAKRKFVDSRLPLPPGPPKDSIYGNTWPTAFGYRKFEEWTKQYGPVFSLRQGTTTIVVIGRLQAAVDIMEKEGANTLERPRSISAGETLSGGMRMLLMPAGERFKRVRRALQSHLQPKQISSYGPIMQKTARQHILDIVEKPDCHQDHAKRYAATVVMATSYGKTPTSYQDPDVQAVNRCLTRLGFTMRPGAYLVDAFPILQYVPGYLTELRQWHQEELHLFRTQVELVRQKMERGEEVPQSFGKYLIEKQSELGLSDSEIAYLAGSMFGAGSDTTASAISVAIMAATCYPEARKRVQDELDSVVGRGRPPVMADQPNLPQTMAFILESFRWRPVTAGGSPHKATKDIIWGGYCIPKGATLIGNVWSVGRDPEVFGPNPEQFDPAKYLNKDGTLRDDLKSYPFGFGRRVCPGQHMATASAFINLSLVLWAFDVKEDPKYPIDTLAFTESANAHPEPFKVVFEPRLQGGWEMVKEAMDSYGM